MPDLSTSSVWSWFSLSTLVYLFSLFNPFSGVCAAGSRYGELEVGSVGRWPARSCRSLKLIFWHALYILYHARHTRVLTVCILCLWYKYEAVGHFDIVWYCAHYISLRLLTMLVLLLLCLNYRFCCLHGPVWLVFVGRLVRFRFTHR